jgi:hypothetical protein
MNNVFINVLIVSGFVTLWLIVWLSISYLAGRVSGWQKLALLYPDSVKEQTGEKKSWLYIRFGKTRYNGAITFEALPSGLRIKAVWFFRFGQPDMVIPWSQITEPKKITTGIWNYLYTHEFLIQGAKNSVLCTSNIAEWLTNKRKEFFV